MIDNLVNIGDKPTYFFLRKGFWKELNGLGNLKMVATSKCWGMWSCNKSSDLSLEDHVLERLIWRRVYGDDHGGDLVY